MTTFVLTTLLLLSPVLAVWYLVAQVRAIRRETPAQRRRRLKKRRRDQDAVVTHIHLNN